MNVRTAGIAVVAAAAFLTAAAGLAQQTPTSPQGPIPPPPPYPGTTPPAANVPIVRPTGGGRAAGRSTPGPAATETPPPQFTNLSGVWEVQAQPPGSQTIYTHLRLQQNADNTVTGYWERGKQQLPINGNFDGRQFKITLQDGKNQATIAGYEDNYSDMVGLIDLGDGKPPVAFTASHRKKSTFFDNVGIGAGGLNGVPQGR